MASNQLTLTQRRAITETAHQIFLRAALSPPCPLVTQEEREVFWENTFANPRLVEAYKTLDEAGYNLVSAEADMLSLFLDNMRLVISYGPDHRRGRGRVLRRDPNWMSPKQSCLPICDALFRGTNTTAAEFSQWMMTKAELAAAIEEARATLTKIVDLANTVGQFVRMVPQLSQLLSSELQTAASLQKRASTMPYQWAQFPRRQLEDLEAILAKCLLLPAVPEQLFVRTTAVDILERVTGEQSIDDMDYSWVEFSRDIKLFDDDL